MARVNQYTHVHAVHIANVVCAFKQVNPVKRMSGYDWYSVTGTYVQSVGYAYGLSDLQSCAIFATISPQKSIDRNHAIFLEYLDTGVSNELTGAQLIKCDNIRLATNDADIDYWIRGPKVRAFHANLMGDYSIPTIDRHAVSLVYGKPLSKVATKCQIDYAKRVFNIAAELIGINVAALQAIVWDTWRAQFGNLGDSDVVFNANWRLRDIAYYPSILFT